ncbi:glycosyltransferase family 2 protein [Burkholderia gladioli]|uniref:glycosyltransferase family 2 protein n=1 Tax=Burkholderia gladioli TaxID=28095 RepID=UPI001640BF37|nr:glycosyltransferase family 2 protein [Burkholderia gladioli]
MLDLNSFRLSWGRSHLAAIDPTEVSAIGPRDASRHLTARLLPGWYMVEMQLEQDKPHVDLTIRLTGQADGTVTALPLAVESNRIAKRLLRVTTISRLEIAASGDGAGFELQHFKLARVSAHFARSRMNRKLVALHPLYRHQQSSGQASLVARRDVWQDYCRLFQSEVTLLEYPEWIALFDTPRSIAHRPGDISFSICIDVADQSKIRLQDTIRSIAQQTYPTIAITILSPLPREPYAFIESEYGLMFEVCSPTSDTPVEQVGSDHPHRWLVFLDAGDRLAPHALATISQRLSATPDACVLYADDDVMDGSGARRDPNFKPDWNADLFLARDYIGKAACIRADIVSTADGPGYMPGPLNMYALLLRCLPGLAEHQIVHVAQVLFHAGERPISWRDWFSHDEHRLAGQGLLGNYLLATGQKADCRILDAGYHIAYAVPDPAPKVSIVIPTRNGYAILKNCIDSILHRTLYRHFEILIVDNGSDEAQTLAYLAELAEHGIATVIRDDGNFNYSRLNNFAARHAEGEMLALVNNDIEVIDGQWLGEMVALASRENTGVVGAKLLYPDGYVQHAGVIVGMSGCADHWQRRIAGNAPGYQFRARLTQSLSAVTGACLLVKTSLYFEVGGLNEQDLPVSFNDIDLCLKVRERGYQIVWTPHALLYHHESLSRGGDDTPEKQERARLEAGYMKDHWEASMSHDPFYNRNLSLDRTDCQLACPPR